MRGVDESKIRDYKEDMDALLVFVRPEQLHSSLF